MADCKPISTPLDVNFKLTSDMSPQTNDEHAFMKTVPYPSVVGSLMYAAIYTRAVIEHATGVIIQFMSNLGPQHWAVVMRILCYLKVILDYGITLKGQKPLMLTGYMMLPMQVVLNVCVSLLATVFSLVKASFAGPASVSLYL